MKIFKITNLTHTFSKRDLNYNKTLEIEYVDGMDSKILLLEPGHIAFLNINELPISLHNLRLKKLIIIEELNENRYKNLLKRNIKKPKKILVGDAEKIESIVVESSVKTKKNTKKSKVIKKEKISEIKKIEE